MDGYGIAILTLVVLAVGVAVGWFVHARWGATDTQLLTRLAASEASVGALREQLGQQQTAMRENLEQARAEREAQREREHREAAVLTALSPVQETLARMQHSVTSLERDRQEQFGTLTEQLRRAHENDESLRAATQSLAGALRSTTVRGTWGETQLRRIVEASGLTHHVDFELQMTIATDDGATGRPDMVVRLPGDKALAVDAKAPLAAFLNAATLDDSDQALAMRAHAKAVRGHVDALAKRTYWAGLPASPEFVVCFLPSEAMLSAALEADPTLLDHAFAQRVALASPVSLWAVLKTVAYTWTQEEVSSQAVELFRLGNQLYERLGTLTGHAAELRASLERAVGAYNRFAGSLESRVLVTARRFPGIDATKIDALREPRPIEESTRQLTAEELVHDAHAEPWDRGEAAQRSDERASTSRVEVSRADIGAVRARVFETGEE